MNCSKDLKRLLAMLVSDDDLRKLDDAHLKELSHEKLLNPGLTVDSRKCSLLNDLC
jgi:hypothetical protein